MRIEEAIDRLETGVGRLMEKAAAYDGAFAKGFEKGVVSALLLMQGINSIDPAEAGVNLVGPSPTRPRESSQLKLF